MTASTSRVQRIGAGSSYADDRIEPSVDLITRGNHETLAERTIALAQLERLKNPKADHDEPKPISAPMWKAAGREPIPA